MGVTNYKVRENERAEEGGENLGVLHGTRKNVKQRRGAFSKNAKNTQKKDLAEDTPSQIDAALTPKEQVKRVGTQEAYDWIIARQSATLEKKFLAKLMDKNAEDDNEDDCVEIMNLYWLGLSWYLARFARSLLLSSTRRGCKNF